MKKLECYNFNRSQLGNLNQHQKFAPGFFSGIILAWLKSDNKKSSSGIFFFGTILGWPNLAEVYKQLGVYESLCKMENSQNLTNDVIEKAPANETINCPARDTMFS